MSSLKKLAILSGIVIIYIIWVTSGNSKKPAPTQPVIKEEVSEIVSDKLDPKEQVLLDPNSNAEQVAEEKSKTIATEVSNRETFIYKDFTPLAKNIVVPVAFLQPQASALFSRLIQINSLREAISGLKGHGYVSFNTEIIQAYYPQFTQILFDKFSAGELPNFFWNEVAGNGKIYFKVPALKQKVQEYLQSLRINKDFVSFVDEDTLKLDLNYSGYKITLGESARLNQFFKKYAEDFNQASLKGEGDIAIMLSSLRFLESNLVKIIEDLNKSNDLVKCLTSLKVDGLMLLDLQTLSLYQSELGKLLNLEAWKASGMLLDKSPQDTYSHEINLQDIMKVHQYNQAAEKKFLEKGETPPHMYQTFIDLPIDIDGDKLLRFSSSLANVENSFAEQKLFVPGTSVETIFNYKLEYLGEKLEQTFLDVLKKIEADRLILYSLANTEGNGLFLFPVNLPEDQLSRLPFIVDTVVGFVEKHNPKPTFKVYLEFISSDLIRTILASSKYNILTQEDFDDKRRVVLTTNEPVKVKLFKELATELAPLTDLFFKGYLEINLALFKTDRHAYQLVEESLEAGSLNIDSILKGIKGIGRIQLYPSTAKFFDQDVVKIITPLFKNNQSAYERWKLIQAQFKMRIPEAFNAEGEKSPLREAYEFINSGATPKMKEQRIKKLIQSFGKGSNSDLAVPQKLNEILDILSDDRKISDVLKDKQDEGF